LWRAYCDRLHAEWLRAWTEGRHFGTALKTDLFDEVVGEGLVEFLLASSDRLHGIDISPSIVQRAVSRHPRLCAEVADVRRLTLDAASFDLVVSNSTLDHFEQKSDVTRALGELIRVLAPGGFLFVTFDNPANPVVALRNRLPSSIFGRTSLAPYFVGHTLSLRALRRELQEAGLDIVRAGYLMHVPRIVFLHVCRLFRSESVPGRRLLRFMLLLEACSKWPTASVSGQFVGVLARKPDS
jgi:SAM-dependent methyltransferase